MGAHPYRTAVTEPAVQTDLVDAADVFDDMGATPTADQTARMESVVTQVSARVASLLGRTLAQEGVTDYFRDIRTSLSDSLLLSRFPVLEIDSILDGTTEIAADGWELDEASGTIWRLDGTGRGSWSTCGALTVAYVGGFLLPDDLPGDLHRAVIDQCRATFMGANRDPAVRSFQVPDVFQASFAVAGGDYHGKSGLLLSVESALLPYRRMFV